MLTAVNGYIEGNKVVVEEDIADWQGRDVVVTILDSVRNGRAAIVEKKTNEENRRNAALEIAGLWKNHKDELSVEETVRNMRKGHRFDI